jgi:sugar lactone lactonase YvrE
VSIAAAANGDLFVGDVLEGVIYRYHPADRSLRVFAGSYGNPGSANGAPGVGRLTAPQALAFLPNGSLAVADYDANTLRLVAADGTLSTLAGNGTSGWADGVGAAARFLGPQSLTADAAGNLYATDAGGTLRRISPDGTVTTLVGSFLQWGLVGAPLPGNLVPCYSLLLLPGERNLLLATDDGILELTIR